MSKPAPRKTRRRGTRAAAKKPSAKSTKLIPPGATRFARGSCTSEYGGSYSAALSIGVVEALGHRHGTAMPGLWIEAPQRSGVPANTEVSWQVRFPSFAARLRLAYAYSGACSNTRENEVTVGVAGLVELPASGDYRLVGADASHPKVHFGQPAAVDLLRRIAAEHRRAQPGTAPLDIGPLSLPFGGAFDFAGDWRVSASHLGHDKGLEADIRKPRSPSEQGALVAAIRRLGGTVSPDAHAGFYHVGLAPGGYANALGEQIVAEFRAAPQPLPGVDCYRAAYDRVNSAVKKVCGAGASLPPLDAFQPFDRLWASKTRTRDADPVASWRKLPAELRGKGAAGAMASIGMGALVDAAGIWAGKLRPGAVLQLWRRAGDFERVREGADPSGIDIGHSVLFLEYVESAGGIVGMKVADQGTRWGDPHTLFREDFAYAVAANVRCASGR